MEREQDTNRRWGERVKIKAKREQFAKARIMLGWSQRELAKRAGLSHAYISLIERSRKTVGPNAALRLSHLLGLELEELFTIE